MRFLSTLFGLALTIGGGVWLWDNSDTLRHFVEKRLETGKFHTLEIRYTTDQFLEAKRKELLKNDQYTFLEPSLLFYPYALLEVKYSLNHKNTGEGVILWGLEDGEMVLNTASWEKTHGLEDCINAKADRNDFRLITTLANAGGAMDRERLLNILHMENENFDVMVESCRKKKLVVQNGNDYRLHFHKPLIQNFPETKLDQWIVTKPYKNATQVPARYGLSQIEATAKNLFANDFAIRTATEIYLPVYRLVVQNPDGTLFTTYWNAVNGKRFIEHPLPEK